MKVKICGITNLEDALAACEAGADALGFVFAEEAKARNRYVDPEEACAIIQQLPPFVLSVAVCVNEPIERLAEYLGFVDRVQLCGEESVEDCRALGPRAIKAFGVPAGFDSRAMLAYPASAYLLDASVRGAHGGTGVTCDWQRARDAVALGRPIILAGGLTPDNVAEAVRTVRPYGVDTSGGVERAPGKKDHERIRRFIENAQTPIS
ncbi:MAG: phosphoribosylanthranilate isomerase [Nitrospiraceae bacterium]|nr:phosphoribosylanthranilate isomerase [Nitrospiraceae bacterium]